MPRQERLKTKYPGVYSILGEAVANAEPENIYYIVYRKDGRQIEEKVGRQFQDAMTPAKASQVRAERINRKAPANKERREAVLAIKQAEENRWTISRLWAEYQAKRQTSNPQDKSRFTLYLAKPFGDKDPGEILTLDVDRLRVKLLKEKTPQTVKHVLALLRRVLRFGVKRGLIDPPSPRRLNFVMPEVHNEKMEMLTDDELRRLWAVLEEETNIQVAGVLKLALATGLRRGNLLTLRWQDIDCSRNLIYCGKTKNGRPLTIPLNSLAKSVLEKHPREFGTDYIFPGRDGGHRATIQRAARQIRDKAGISKDFRYCHGLRHVFASHVASSGMANIQVLQDLLGHRLPSQTTRYSHLLDSTLKGASESIADVMAGIINEPKPKGAKVVNLKIQTR